MQHNGTTIPAAICHKSGMLQGILNMPIDLEISLPVTDSDFNCWLLFAAAVEASAEVQIIAFSMSSTALVLKVLAHAPCTSAMDISISTTRL